VILKHETHFAIPECGEGFFVEPIRVDAIERDAA
jgi:hypothetical protein